MVELEEELKHGNNFELNSNFEDILILDAKKIINTVEAVGFEEELECKNDFELNSNFEDTLILDVKKS